MADEQKTKDASQDGKLGNLLGRVQKLEDDFQGLALELAKQLDESSKDVNARLDKLAKTKGAKGTAELARRVDALWANKSFSA